MAHRPILRLAAASTLLLLAGTTAACGDGDGDGGSKADGPPTNAAKKDFCAAVADPDLPEDALTDKAKLETAFKKWTAELEEVGTPEGIPDDARDGFEIALREFDKVDWDKSLPEIAEGMQKLEEDLPEADQKKMDAFDTYQEKTCK